MHVKEINSLLKSIIRPIDFFGDISTEDIKKKYRLYAKHCHPDVVSDDDKELSEETIILLNEIYNLALKEIELGIYNITDKKELYKHMSSLFEFEIDDNKYRIYEQVSEEDVTSTYRGLDNDGIMYLRICNDKDENALLDEEYILLRKLDHISIPKVKEAVKINGKSSLVFSDYGGLNAEEIIEEYGFIPGNHIVWILERLLSVVGYLHSNNIVHGNIKPSNVYIDPVTHNIKLIDYSLCINNANEKSSKYRIINDIYTPEYVDSNSEVTPNTDIYSIGKLAIHLIGGDEKRNALPLVIDERIRSFVRKLLDKNENDAWGLWSELIKLRNEVYGTKRFQKLEHKYRR